MTNVLKSSVDNIFNIPAVTVRRGESLSLRIENIPNSPTANPLLWEWQVRTEPAFVDGYQNWSTGALVQANTGILATTTTDFVDINLPIVNTFAIGDSFSFIFMVGEPLVNQAIVSVIYKVNSSTPNSVSPISPILNVLSRGQKVLTAEEVALLNSTGLGISTFTNYDGSLAGVPNLLNRSFEQIGRNSALILRDEYSFSAGGVLAMLDPISYFVTGDLLVWQFLQS